jgi:hypothetical protein
MNVKTRMIRPRVVTTSTLTTILSRHSSFSDSETIRDVAPLIREWANASRYGDIVHHLIPAFDGWKRVTPFLPGPSTPPNINVLMGLSPVNEYTRFGGYTFYRKRHSLGVLFATFVLVNDILTGVVWTTKRRAHLFQKTADDCEGWSCVKTLNRQDVPFVTWMRFLGGCDVVSAFSPLHNYRNTVLAYFGHDEFATGSPHFLESDHPTWEIVRKASLITAPADDACRFQWMKLCRRPAW